MIIHPPPLARAPIYGWRVPSPLRAAAIARSLGRPNWGSISAGWLAGGPKSGAGAGTGANSPKLKVPNSNCHSLRALFK